ncbi:MAG: ribbon-helix-helix protein, CopG family, partial [Halobacteria archaeon]|nr:ribbon-helix-helix protein, CopG family [Halobacteria archaeon]
MSVVSVSIPDELLERIDGFVEQHGYSGRSEFVRDAASELLDEFEDAELEGRELVATLNVIFDFASSDIENRMV